MGEFEKFSQRNVAVDKLTENHRNLAYRLTQWEYSLAYLLAQNNSLGKIYRTAFASKQADEFSVAGAEQLLNARRVIAVTGTRVENINERERGLLEATIMTMCSSSEANPNGMLRTGDNPDGALFMSGLATGTDSITAQKAIDIGAQVCGVPPSRVLDSKVRGSLTIQNGILVSGGVLISPEVRQVNLGDKSGLYYHWRNLFMTATADVLLVGPGNAEGGTFATVELAAMCGTPIMFIVGGNKDRKPEEYYNYQAMLRFLRDYTNHSTDYLAELAKGGNTSGVYGTERTSSAGRTQKTTIPFAAVQDLDGLQESIVGLYGQKFQPRNR